MKNFSLFFCLFTLLSVNAQNSQIAGQVIYDYQLNPSEETGFYNVTSILNFSNNTSLYEIDHSKATSQTSSDMDFNIKSEENEFVYKDYRSQNMYYIDFINFTEIFIKDNLNMLDWTLNENTKEILGYQCQEATTSYGGRFYIAYYTSEIPVANGPWRFNGLPGLILEVQSIDKVFNLKATSIKIEDKQIEIKNPYKNKTQITWQEFLDLYKKKYDEVLRNNMTEFGPRNVMAKRGIVEYIKE
jgi:GLPGLI family protein